MHKYLIGLLFGLLIACGTVPVTQASGLSIQEVNPSPAHTKISGVDPDERAMVLGCLNGWNNALGFKCFDVVESEPDLTILTTHQPFGIEDEESVVGVFDEEDNTIRLRAGMSGLDLKITAYHELGHSLGLEHNSSEYSIMYPTIEGILVDSPSSIDVKNVKDIIFKEIK